MRGGPGCMAAAPADRPGAAQGDALLAPGSRWRSRSGPWPSRPGRPAPPRAACMSTPRTTTPARWWWRRRRPRPRRAPGGRGAPAAGRGAGRGEGQGRPLPPPLPTGPAAESSGLADWPLPHFRLYKSPMGIRCAPPCSAPASQPLSPPHTALTRPHRCPFTRRGWKVAWRFAPLCSSSPSAWVSPFLTPSQTRGLAG